MKKKILIVGSGGREHALGWKLGQSDEVSEVFYAKGNAGTEEGKGRNVRIDGTKKDNFELIYNFVKHENIDIVVVGPEIPLADGIVDYFHKKGYSKVFGPTKKGALLESDKFFSSDLMNELDIPQANSVKCHNLEEAVSAIKTISTYEGVVIKSRGLANGKGVNVCNSEEQALNEIKSHLSKYGEEVLIAERLFGQEFSVFGISDGKKVSPLEISVQDHKRLLDKDEGKNTGGMGAYCPVPIISKDTIKNISQNVMNPIVERMREKDIDVEYKGFLYVGMIMTQQGPRVIEFNVRLGDPECQPLMMTIKEGLYESISLALEGKLNGNMINFNPGAACCVVAASEGYPGRRYEKGCEIQGLDEAGKLENVKVFHSATRLHGDKIVTDGGRVLGITAYSQEGIREAQNLAYRAVSKIEFQGKIFRGDIGNKALII